MNFNSYFQIILVKQRFYFMFFKQSLAVLTFFLLGFLSLSFSNGYYHQTTAAAHSDSTCRVSNTYDHLHGQGQLYGGVLPRFDDINDKYRFVIVNGTLRENADGTASFTGAIQHKGHSNGFLTFHIRFTGLVGSVGGTQTHYYSHISGSLTGPTGSRYEGARISITGKNRDGYPIHIGIGNNYQENVYGGSFWFDWTIIQQPSTGVYLPLNSQGIPNGDFNFRLSCGGSADTTTKKTYQQTTPTVKAYQPPHHQTTPAVNTYEHPPTETGSSSLTCVVSNTYDYSHGQGQLYGGVLPRFDDINDRYRFVILNGVLTEHSDGTADFTGRIQHKGHSDGYLDFNIRLTGLVGSVGGMQTYYYSHISGLLTGLTGSRYEGASISITGKNRDGYPVHIGVGNNYQENVYGGSFWFGWTTVQQPSTGVYLPPNSQGIPNGDFNFRLNCEGSADQAVEDPYQQTTPVIRAYEDPITTVPAINTYKYPYSTPATTAPTASTYEYPPTTTPATNTYQYPSAEAVSSSLTCVVSNTYDYSHGQGQLYGGVLPRFDDIDDKYRFIILNGTLTEHSDGTADFTGRIQHKGHSDGYLDFNIRFTNLVGSVSGTQTHYYSHISGSLTGPTGSRYEGASISITGKNRDGYPIHIGVGNNYQENVYGGSFWFDWTTIQQPSTSVYLPLSSQGIPNGDFNFRLSC